MTGERVVSGDAVFEQMAKVRQNLVERMWHAFFLLSLLVFPVLVWRLANILIHGQSGTLGINIVFVTMTLVILIAFPFRRKIPFSVRAAMPVLILSIVGFSGLLVFGAASTAYGWVVQGNFLISTLYSLRAGIVATVLTAASALVVGILFLSGVMVNAVDLNAFVLLPTTWILFLLGTTVVPTIILYSIGGYQKTIGELLTSVQSKRDRLDKMSRQLSEALHAQERANEAKSEFLAHMTHELRTPLSGVIGMLEIAEKRNQDPELGHLLAVSLQNAESLLGIINDVLDFSKIEAGKITLDPEYFDLNSFLAGSMEVFRLRADEKNIRFRYHVDPQLNTIRYADPMRLRQVLFNLISNALKFTNVGQVDLEVKRAVPELPDDTRVQFVVRDTGVGIPAHAIAKLFREFEQADSSVQKRYGGTGLGLAISKMLVDAMGGTVSVQSRVGEGTRFEVVLPLATHSGEHVAAAPLAPSPLNLRAHGYQLNILLAEDMPTNQMVARTFLEDMGHRVQIVETGIAALDAASRENFDLILMDLRMPELGGCEAAVQIRQGGTGIAPVMDRDVFICAMTANATPQEREKTERVGMNDFLTKPVRVQELHALVQRAVDFQMARGVALVPALQVQDVDLAQLDHLLEVGELDHGPEPGPVASSAGGGRGIAPEWQADLRAVFSQDVRMHLRRLEGFVAESNWEGVREVAHAVCGAAAALSLEALKDVAAQLESACLGPIPQQRVWLEKQLRGLMADFLKENE